MKNKRSFPVYLLWLIVLYQAVSGLFGGAALIYDPQGHIFNMPVFVLNGSPFEDYLIPGIILFVLLGIVPLVTLYGLIRPQKMKFLNFLNVYSDQAWSWTYSLYTGIMLIIWMDVQIMVIGGGHFLQTIYAFVGVAIVIITLLPPVKRYYQVEVGQLL